MHRLWIIALCVGLTVPAHANALSRSDVDTVERAGKELMATDDAIHTAMNATMGNGAERIHTLSAGQIEGVNSDSQCLMQLGDISGTLDGYFYALITSTGTAVAMVDRGDRARADGAAKLAFVQAVRMLTAEKKPIQDMPAMYDGSPICQIKSDELLRTIDSVTSQLDPVWKSLGSPPVQPIQ